MDKGKLKTPGPLSVLKPTGPGLSLGIPIADLVRAIVLVQGAALRAFVWVVLRGF